MYSYIKRIFDISSSMIAFIILCPLLAVIAILIKLTSSGPVLFKQKRIGKDKKYFFMLKFRSMYIDTPKDIPTHLLHAPYAFITPIGRFMRRTSIDELPQLWNILRGDMSVVGPRPALWNQEDLIAERDKCNSNSVRPGLTGLAQVMGRDELPIAVKASYDNEYTSNIRLSNDVKIILKTVSGVFKGEGIAEGSIIQTVDRKF